jgi:hypothetical protein
MRLVAKIHEDGSLSGVYKSLVPNFRGNFLPFTAEYGKTYRFVEPSKEQKPIIIFQANGLLKSVVKSL